MKSTQFLTYVHLLFFTFLLSHSTLSHPTTTAATVSSLSSDIHFRGHFTCTKTTVRGPTGTSTRALIRQIERWQNTQCTQNQRFGNKCTDLAKDGDEARIAICGYTKGWIQCSLVAYAAMEIVDGCDLPVTGRAAGEFVFDDKPGLRIVVYKAGNRP